MCGLVGAAGMLGDKEEKAFITLLQLDTIRGPHSTGVLVVNTHKHATVHKELGTPWDLMDSRKFEKAMNGVNNVLLGHNRYATKGAINVANAHPFVFNNVIGAHNGTLVSQFHLDDYKDFDVDSENIYHHMNNNGVEDTIAKLNGAFALTWYDKEEHTINFIRNSQRPLYYTFSKDRKTLFWASEEWMLNVALGRNGVEHNGVLSSAEMHHCSIKVNFGGPHVVKAFDAMSIRKLEDYKAPVYNNPHINNRVTERQIRPAGEAVVELTRNKAPQPFQDYSKYIREEVEFSVEHAGVTKYKQPYIQGYLVDNDKLAVRIYALRDSEVWKELMSSPNTFKAKTLSYVAEDNGYLSVGLSTIVEILPPLIDDTPPETYTVYNNHQVSAGEFLQLTSKHGCAWCSDPQTTKDADDLVWISKDDFVCAACQEDPSVVTYLAAAGK